MVLWLKSPYCYKGLTHSVSKTAANARDITKTANLLHAEEYFISADSHYRGVQKREELKVVKADWFIAEIPSKTRILKKYPRKTADQNRIHKSQYSNTPLESSSVSLVLEKLFIVG
jgi:IS5 family transposase